MRYRSTCPVCLSPDLAGITERPNVPVHQNKLYDTQADARAATRGHLKIVACLTCGFVFNAAFDLSILEAELARYRLPALASRLPGGDVRPVVDPRVQPYDVAAAAVLIREAGGRLTSLRGEDTIYGPGALASNGHLHASLLALVQSATG